MPEKRSNTFSITWEISTQERQEETHTQLGIRQEGKHIHSSITKRDLYAKGQQTAVRSFNIHSSHVHLFRVAAASSLIISISILCADQPGITAASVRSSTHLCLVLPGMAAASCLPAVWSSQFHHVCVSSRYSSCQLPDPLYIPSISCHLSGPLSLHHVCGFSRYNSCQLFFPYSQFPIIAAARSSPYSPYVRLFHV
jgi:hypothetical protein